MFEAVRNVRNEQFVGSCASSGSFDILLLLLETDVFLSWIYEAPCTHIITLQLLGRLGADS